MSTVLITGGTGLVGTALSNMLVAQGNQVTILSRDQKRIENRRSSKKGGASKKESIRFAYWNVEQRVLDSEAIQTADYIVHLAGAGVAEKRWTVKRKKEILESRTQSSALLIKTLRDVPNKVKAVISASAIGWYGADATVPSKKPFLESDPPDPGFLGETCRLWEESIGPVNEMGIRLVKLRTGIALSREGGAFPEFRKPLLFGVAGILGSGNQVVSWIHIDDLCRMYMFAIANESTAGVFNAVAPKPVSNKQLTLQLAKSFKKNFFVPMHVPSFALQLMIGEMKEEVLKSATVCCDKIRKEGFNFIFPSIENAINELVKK